MTLNEKYVCDIFRVNSVAAVPKSDLIRSIVNLSLECEGLNMDLFHEKPDHGRFARIPPEQRKQMEQESLRRKAAAEQAAKAAVAKEERSKNLADEPKAGAALDESTKEKVPG
jgi:hypothetical protein